MERTPSNNQVSKELKENDMSTLRRGHVKEKIEIFEENRGLLKKTFAKDEMNEEIFEENKEEFTKIVAESEPKIAESAQDKQESEAELAKNETNEGHVKRMKEKFENKTDESKQETACGHSEDRSSTYNTGLPRSTLDLPGHGTQGSSYSYSEAAMSPHSSLLPLITSLSNINTYNLFKKLFYKLNKPRMKPTKILPCKLRLQQSQRELSQFHPELRRFHPESSS
ncbi:uncharacterized protein [Saccopteryx leptura]|uniref:uncharacterized protein n=1 Tax=Saccopteryx leptura TaxID=249018 RepID=UPI00339CCA06